MLGALLERVRGKVRDIPPENRPPLILEPAIDIPDCTPDLAEPCFCGSEKLFKSCCGSREPRRKSPYGIFIVENYLDAFDAAQIRAMADNCQGNRLMVIDSTASTKENLVMTEDQRRVSEHVELGVNQEHINELTGNAFIELCERFTGQQLAWYERPQILRYREGGFYIRHADSENMNPETRRWNKTIDRDFSLLIYLNDDYKGGELYFPKFNYTLRPKAGMAVLFPSDNRYLHEAQIVTQGTRYAIVSWAAVEGVKKVRNRPPDCAIPC